MGEATEENGEELSDAINSEDVLTALCIDAQENPETFNASSLKSALEAAGMGDIWEDAKVLDDENEDDEDEDDEDEDEDEDEDATTDDDEDEEVEEGEGDEEAE